MLYYKLLENGEMGATKWKYSLADSLYLICMSRSLHMNCYIVAKRKCLSMVDSDAATIDVLVNSFLSIGFEEVTKGKPGFVNFTENLLMSSIHEFLNPSQVVIEILEDVPLTSQLVERVIELKTWVSNCFG